MADPNPGVTGGGAQTLEAQGIEVHGDILREQCEALNEVFMVNVIEHRPFGFLKMAMSLDGRIATKTGHSQWITSPPARRQVHRLRDRVSAVMVGIGTVLADDPRLTVRLAGTRWRNPVRVIADSDLRIPLNSALFEDLPDTELIVACKRKPNPEKKKALEAAGAMVIETKGADRVDLGGLSDALFDRGITSVLVEGGAGLAWGALEAGIIDRCLFYYAPMIIGGADAPSGVAGEGAETLQDAFRLEGIAVSGVGDDVQISGRVRRNGI
jgi:diaminohydroxyphosphoribosylaminopyrimidine deaminase/5-amino-6-(5-phosphoribosylamino)uracil reductase